MVAMVSCRSRNQAIRSSDGMSIRNLFCTSFRMSNAAKPFPLSVSYTHLDVYKRQLLRFQPVVGDHGAFRGEAFGVFRFLFQIGNRNQEGEVGEMCIRDSTRTQATIRSTAFPPLRTEEEMS